MPDLFSISKLKMIFTLLSFILITPAFSQSDDDEVMLDTTVVTTVQPGEEDEFIFDSISGIPPTITPRELPDSVYDNLRKDEDYWYVNLPPPRQKPKAQEQREYKQSWMESQGVKNFVLVLIICIFVGAVIWFLSSSNIKLFESPKRLLDDVNAEITEEDLFSIPFENEIRNAVMAGNFRLAIRLWYLRTLRELTDKNLIRYGHEKTNTEYLDELFNTKYYKEFRKLTRNFEYAWYGKFELTAESYQMVEKEFAEFNRYMR
jgi:hypothetical protein